MVIADTWLIDTLAARLKNHLRCLMKETDDEWEKRVSALGTVALVRETRKRVKAFVKEAEEEGKKFDWLYDESLPVPHVEPPGAEGKKYDWLDDENSEIPLVVPEEHNIQSSSIKEGLSFDDVKFEFRALVFSIVHEGLFILVPILTFLIIGWCILAIF
jgi:hypothetical protein